MPTIAVTDAVIAQIVVFAILGALGGLAHALWDKTAWDPSCEYEFVRRAVFGAVAALALAYSGLVPFDVASLSVFAFVLAGYFGTDILMGITDKFGTIPAGAAATTA